MVDAGLIENSNTKIKNCKNFNTKSFTRGDEIGYYPRKDLLTSFSNESLPMLTNYNTYIKDTIRMTHYVIFLLLCLTDFTSDK